MWDSGTVLGAGVWAFLVREFEDLGFSPIAP